MNENTSLFGEKYQKSITQNIQVDAKQLEYLKLWQNEIINELEKTKKNRRSEKEIHEQFFTDIFEKTLGYQKRSSGLDEWTIISESKTDVDATRPDGRLGFFNNQYNNDVQVVIELKSPGTDLDLRQNRKNDRRTPVEQAFSYAHKFGKVKWVIVSNYNELRLYHHQSSRHALHFDLTKITDNEQEARLFFHLLSKKNLLARNEEDSTTTKLFNKREEELKKITERFYKNYKIVRSDTAKVIFAQADYTVDHAVALAQTILDRIIFIIFLEGLNLIPKDTIKKAYETHNDFNPTPLWDNFKGLFKALDQGSPPLNIPKYNGGLFKHDEDIQNLTITDGILEKYKNFTTYDFRSELRVDILGHIFEQSITDLAVLKATLRDEKNTDTRRHDEGAYYTPYKVTAYITERTIDIKLTEIRNSLGFDALPELEEEWLTDKTNKSRAKHIAFWENYKKQLSQLKILDPSCGSGAFLVAAFDALLKEYEQIQKELGQFDKEMPLLDPISVERDILSNNLYGVDISFEAIEITKLSLWLKIARHRKPLTALDDAIKLGNSLIENKQEAGFYYKYKGEASIQKKAVFGEGELSLAPEEEEDHDRSKALGFDWKQEFPEIFKQGGFDIIIGNPPYVRHELIEKTHKQEIKKQFITATGTTDLYVPFYELSYNLLKENGYFGCISSNKWMRAKYGEKLRGFIKDKTSVTHLLDLTGHRLFDDAVVDTNILIFKKQKPLKTHQLMIEEQPFIATEAYMPQSQLSENGYNLESNSLFWQVKEKIEHVGTALKDWNIEINRGILTGFNEAFIIDDATKEQLIKEDAKSAEILKPLLRGRDLKRWHADWQGLWLIYVPWHFPLHKDSSIQGASTTAETLFRKSYPAIYNHLFRYKHHLENRNKSETGIRYEWYALQRWGASYHEDFEKEKIIYPDIEKESSFSLDKDNLYHNNTAYHITGKNLSYLTAILNSRLIHWYIQSIASVLGEGAIRWFEIYLQELPIPILAKNQQQVFITLSETLHNFAENRHKTRKKFLILLKEEFAFANIDKLNNWDKGSFGDVLKTLKKYKITLKGKTKEDWLDRFTRLQSEIKELDQKITTSENELNQLTYQLYGLTEKEIEFVEK